MSDGQKNQPYGFAGLDSNGLVQLSVLPISTVGTNGIGQPDGVTLTTDILGVWSVIGGGGSGVSSFNLITGAVVLNNTGGLTITPNGQNLEIKLTNSITPGSGGSASTVPVISYDEFGQLTDVVDTPIVIDAIASINNDTTPNQIISNGVGILVSNPSAGTTEIAAATATTASIGSVIVTNSPSQGNSNLSIDDDGNITTPIGSATNLGVLMPDQIGVAEQYNPFIANSINVGGSPLGIVNFNRIDSNFTSVVNFSDNTFSTVLFGGGTWSNISGGVVSTGANTNPYDMAYFDDVGGSNNLYVVISNSNAGSGAFSVFQFNDSNVNFDTTPVFTAPAAIAVTGIEMQQIDGLWYLYLANTAASTVDVYKWDGVSSFSSLLSIPVTANPSNLTAFRINEEYYFAVSYATASNNISVFRYVSDSSYIQAGGDIPTGQTPTGLDFVAINGLEFLAVVCNGDGIVQIFEFVGGIFDPSTIQTLIVGTSPVIPLFSKYNGVTYLSITNSAGGDNSLYSFIFNNAGSFVPINTVSSLGSSPAYLVNAQIDGNNYILVSINGSTNLSQLNFTPSGVISNNMDTVLPGRIILQSFTLAPSSNITLTFTYSTPFVNVSYYPTLSVLYQPITSPNLSISCVGYSSTNCIFIVNNLSDSDTYTNASAQVICLGY